MTFFSQQNPELVKVHLNQCNSLTDKAVESLSLSCTNLQDLSLGRCKGITFNCIQYLSLGCRKMIRLGLSKCGIFGPDKAPLVRLPHLRNLDLVACSWIGQIALMAIAKVVTPYSSFSCFEGMSIASVSQFREVHQDQ